MTRHITYRASYRQINSTEHVRLIERREAITEPATSSDGGPSTSTAKVHDTRNTRYNLPSRQPVPEATEQRFELDDSAVHGTPELEAAGIELGDNDMLKFKK